VKLDFEDEDMAELACEGVESMLIDWQGGFLGKKKIEMFRILAS
jgi:hypothetical protein